MQANSIEAKFFFFLITIVLGCVSSYYYQMAVHMRFNRDIAVCSSILGCFLFLFGYIGFGWHLFNSIFSGILGGIIFTHRVT